ncbi:MAG: ribonuclease HII [Actinomycetota bacterium]|nr:ribonuclease HII [Actinomycetota bacterium]
MDGDAIGLLEARLADGGFSTVAGADEVGRGALAGPLVAAAVVLPADVEIDGLRDSKLCTRAQREDLERRIRDVALAVSVVRVQPWKIDRSGLQKCNLQALRRALKRLDVSPDYVLVDCFKLKRLPYPALAVKKGDLVSKAVAAASIVAKVHRDAAMRRYHRKHPRYGFATNVGYGTREHWDALNRWGPCDIHRRSFFGVMGFPDDAEPRRRRGARRPDQVLESGVIRSPEVSDFEDVDDVAGTDVEVVEVAAEYEATVERAAGKEQG